jgi:hypothetical protein
VTNSHNINASIPPARTGEHVIQRKIPLRILAVFCLLIALTAPLHANAAITYPVDFNKFIVDETNMLDESELNILEDISYDLYDEWGTEVLMVMINSTADYETENTSNTSTVDFTIGLFDEWKLYESEYDDTILMVLATNQSGNWSLAVETGAYWLDNGDFNDIGIDADAYFDSESWFPGMRILLQDMTDMVDWWLCGDECEQMANTGIPTPVSTDPNAQAEELSMVEGMMCMGFLVVLVLVAFFVFRSGGNGGYYGGGGGWRGGWGYRRGYSNNVNQTNVYTGGHGGGQAGGANNTQQQPQEQTRRPRKTGGGTRGIRRGGGGSGRGGGGGSRSGFSRSGGGGGGGRSRGGGGGGGGRSRGGGGGGRRRR